MRLLICFDICEDKLRRELVKILEKYGWRCQYSVFESILPIVEYKKMIAELKTLCLSDKDKLYIYPIPYEQENNIFRIGVYSTSVSVFVF
jgi:CRISPR-associated protein Cas2